MLTALGNVGPIFLVIGLGALLRRRGFVSAEGAATLSSLVFRVAAPIYLLRSVAGMPLGEGTMGVTLVVIVVVSVLMAAAVYRLARRQPRDRVGVIAQGAFRSNTVFYGLPVVASAYGEAAVGRAAVVIGVMVVTYNLLGVLVLALPRRRVSARSADIWRGALRDMAGNPLVLGILGGVVLSLAGWAPSGVLDRAMELVGRTALPLALLSMGAGLDVGHLPHEWRPTLLVSFAKLVVYPGVIWLTLGALGVEGDALRVPVVLLSSPCAVMGYIMVREMDSDARLAGAIVIGSTLLAAVTSVGWLLVLG
jgi:hypothetical protein